MVRSKLRTLVNDDRTDALALMHVIEGFVNIFKGHGETHHFVHFDGSVQILLHIAGKLRAALDAAKGRALPDAPGDQLKSFAIVARGEPALLISAARLWLELSSLANRLSTSASRWMSHWLTVTREAFFLRPLRNSVQDFSSWA